MVIAGIKKKKKKASIIKHVINFYQAKRSRIIEEKLSRFGEFIHSIDKDLIHVPSIMLDTGGRVKIVNTISIDTEL